MLSLICPERVNAAEALLQRVLHCGSLTYQEEDALIQDIERWLGRPAQQSLNRPMQSESECAHTNKDFKSINNGERYRDKFYRCRDCGARIKQSEPACVACGVSGGHAERCSTKYSDTKPESGK